MQQGNTSAGDNSNGTGIRSSRTNNTPYTAAALASLSGDVRLHSLRSESDILSGPGRECQDCQGGWRSSGRVADKRRRVAEFREGGGG